MLLVCTEGAKNLCNATIGCPLSRALQRCTVLKSLQVPFRDPTSNQLHSITELRLSVTDIDDIPTKPNPATVKKILFDSVSAFNNSQHLENVSSFQTPWFDEWKVKFLSTFETCDHEFSGANFGCIFVMTSVELQNFKEVINSLQTHVKSIDKEQLVNDNSVTPEHSQPFNELVAFYGLNHCFWFNLVNNHENNHVNEHSGNDVTDHIANYNNVDYDHPLTIIEEPVKGYIENNGINVEESKVTVDFSDKLINQLDLMLRCFVSKALVPWSEKQLRVLSESISLRKGLRRSLFSATKSFFVMSSSSVNFRGGQTVVYSSEANEMQQRKYADVAMCLSLYEIAYGFYYSARKEFQSESAWLYYAGASECCAIASLFINKFQKHYFDQAISCYLETCKSTNLAARSTLFATEALRTLWPNEAASLFIRMTSEENDLRSALFLEQAAKCFIDANVSRKRKAAFHYVLAGHRYNRCGLKRHALSCYLRYSTPHWLSAIDHVNFTAAKLYLQICNILVDENSKNVYRNNGLEILRSNSDTEIFFNEFIKEIRKDDSTTNNSKNLYLLKVPFVRSVFRESVEGSNLLNKRQICYVNEIVNVHLTLRNSFHIILNNFKLLCNTDDIVCEPISVELQPFDDQTVTLKICPKIQCDFDLLGVQYTLNNILFVCNFHEKLLSSLKFKSIVALPPIDIGIKVSSLVESVDAVELFAGEIVDLCISLKMSNSSETWIPSKVLLSSNCCILSGMEPNNFHNNPIVVKFNEKNFFKLQAPTVAKTYSLYFKVECFDGLTNKSRTFVKNIELYVRECLNIDGFIENVISLKNVLSNNAVTLIGELGNSCELYPALTAHILVNSDFVTWKFGDRKGVINLPKNNDFLSH
ncbi:trafficking protein particle complex subunit 8-like protein [Leptotrombidium deliense]|uniref:Trafficking protein particle complex subunit 8-like protein n=1 Tax=Leptotrombidium deliense TaxID=299467 RepID=A0A443SCW9_9ACAR|nr:trafficking protein particle complex subunit 8-like protein [Leptotrombidium deliense]